MSLNQEQYELLESYVSGTLDAAGRAQIEALLAENPQLQQMLKALTAHRDMLRQLPRASAPEDLLESFQGQLEREALLGDSAIPIGGRRHSERWPRFVLAASIAFLVLGLAGLIYEVLPEHRDTIPIVYSPGVSTDLDRTATMPSTTPVLGDLGSVGGTNIGLSDSTLGNTGIAPPTTQILNGTLAKVLGGSGGAAFAPEENLRQLKQTLEQNATTNPSNIPVVIVVRSENPNQADAQVAQFLQSNGITFQSTSPRQSQQFERSQTNTQQLATTLPGTLGDTQRDLVDKLTFKARYAAPLPVTLPSTPVTAAAAKDQEPHSQALALQGGQQITQDRAPAQVTYRALLTDQQVQLLNAELLDRPNQWTEVHGQIATDALPANAMRNAVTIAQTRATTSEVTIAEKGIDREKLNAIAAPSPNFGASFSLGAVTQPVPTTHDLSLVAPASQPAALPAELSPIATTTQPITIATTVPSQMRTCLIIVNTQPVSFPATSETATTETATTEPAATQP